MAVLIRQQSQGLPRLRRCLQSLPRSLQVMLCRSLAGHTAAAPGPRPVPWQSQAQWPLPARRFAAHVRFRRHRGGSQQLAAKPRGALLLEHGTSMRRPAGSQRIQKLTMRTKLQSCAGFGWCSSKAKLFVLARFQVCRHTSETPGQHQQQQRHWTSSTQRKAKARLTNVPPAQTQLLTLPALTPAVVTQERDIGLPRYRPQRLQASVRTSSPPRGRLSVLLELAAQQPLTSPQHLVGTLLPLPCPPHGVVSAVKLGPDFGCGLTTSLSRCSAFSRLVAVHTCPPPAGCCVPLAAPVVQVAIGLCCCRRIWQLILAVVWRPCGTSGCLE